jgi:hypothetical protein
VKRPSPYAIETSLTWLGVAAFFALLWKFPGLDHWLFSPFRDHIHTG